MSSDLVSLNHYCDINPETVSKDYEHKSIRYIDISSVGTGTFNEEPKTMLLSEAPSRAKRIVRQNDTIISTVRPNRRSFKFLNNVMPNDVASTGFAVLRPKKNVNPHFLYYIISDQKYTDYIVSHATGSAYPAVSPDSIISAPVPLFDYEEQTAIADVLSTLDDKIELNRQMCETLEKTASTLFKSWFVDFDPVKAKMEGRIPEGMEPELLDLFPDSFKDSDLGPIPAGWKIDEIGNLLEAVGGGTPSTKNADFWDGEHYWATPKDLSSLSHHVLLKTERQITEKGLNKISSGLLPEGTILMSSRAPIGYVAVAEVPVAINQGFIAMKCTGLLGTQFVLQWTLANVPKIKSYANGSTFQEISKKAFRPIKVTYPDNGLLDEFENIASSLHKRCVDLVKQNNKLTEMRDNLLPKLISGELRVEDVGGV